MRVIQCNADTHTHAHIQREILYSIADRAMWHVAPPSEYESGCEASGFSLDWGPRLNTHIPLPLTRVWVGDPGPPHTYPYP